ncbi:MAG: class I SAM-dependent methyltransferase, partial [Rhodobiaceae bacterium]|nr:class I SAM-dependent methyltransferase [Rhodobiaceae bacterium]
MTETSDTTHFGYRDVPVGDKEAMVGEVFHKVARRYDLMNDLMSGGLHRLWKAAMIDWLAPPRRGAFRLLDVAGGTGDIAFRFCDRASPAAQVAVLDINGSMLAVGQERAEKQGYADRCRFVEANAEELPFGDGEYDAYTIAFG